MKTVLRLIGLVLMLGGWGVAALCLHIVRVPDAGNPSTSKFVVIPKSRLAISDTYVDARGWTGSDVGAHAELIRRVLSAGKAEQFKFMTDSRSRQSAESQLEDDLKSAAPNRHGAANATRVSLEEGTLRGFDVAISY